MKNKFLTVLLFACASGSLIADNVPGYLGRKFSVGINASSFFMFEDFSSVSDMLFSTRFSYKSELALSYTVGRKASLGASFYYGKQRYLAGEKEYVLAHYVRNVELEDDYLTCRLMIFEFNAKFYRRNFIAPIGPYHQLGIGIVKYNATAPGDTLVLVDSQNHNTVDVLEIPEDPYSCVKLSYHIGYSAPVFRNCYFNFAFGVNFFRGGDSAKVKSDDYQASTYIPAVLNKHLRRHNFFEIKIGFGWLAF